MASRPISPVEPTKKHPPFIQPNAHPYAIKTTSSALLSRSNSSPHSAHHTRHHYIPSPQIPTGMRARHHHSSSLPLVDVNVRTVPMPFPTPPSTVAAAFAGNPSLSSKREDEPKITHRMRAETMPSSSATAAITGLHHNYDQKHKYSHDQGPGPQLYAGLPANPKRWNTDELVTYLETSLRSGNNTNKDKDDSLAGILQCVRTRGLTGRELLRLTDSDLAGTPLSDMQRAQLLERSHILRADILRERIYVDSYHSHELSDNSNDIYSRSTRSSTPFQSLRGASVSADDLRLLPDSNTCESTFPPSLATPLHRSNSISDASTQRYRDLAYMRMRRRGKVKGLVETWERASTSGSEYSASEGGSVNGSEAEFEGEIDPEFELALDAKHSPESVYDPSSPLHDETPHDVSLTMGNSTVVLQEPPSLISAPPYTHTYTTPGVVEDEEEEPSIEELLASSSSIPLSGARAWEADFGLRETVKRIPVSMSADAGSPSPLVTEPDTLGSTDDGGQNRGHSVQLNGSVRGSTGSKGKSAKTQKRVVTAIFTGSPPDDVPKGAGNEMVSVDHPRLASGVNGVVCDQASASLDLQNNSDSVLRTLEESIAETRTQVETLRLRLEEFEADTARREAEFERAQMYSDRSSEFELKRRRQETSKEATPDTAELPKDGTLSGDFKNTDVLGGWKTMSMRGMAHAIVAKAVEWVFPYGHVGAATCKKGQSQVRTGSHPGVNDRYSSLAKSGPSAVVRMSCSFIFASFAICAAVLRRMGFGRWVRRP